MVLIINRSDLLQSKLEKNSLDAIELENNELYQSALTNPIIIGDYTDINKVVVKVEELPNFPYEDITDIDVKFYQRIFDGKYAELTSYSELNNIKILIEKYGEADSLSELYAKGFLEQENQIIELQDAIAELVVI